MNSRGRYGGVVAVSGLGLLGCVTALALLSPRFSYGGEPLERPFLVLVALLMAAGAVYLAGLAALLRMQSTKLLVAWVLGIGVALRAAMLLSSPILEDDFYRYLWDGGVAASGHNPYAYVPEDIFEGAGDREIPEGLRALAAQSGIVADRLNHPYLGTVYPPVAQGAFVLAHWLRPWDLMAWRVVLLCFDAAVLGLVLVLLRRMGKPLHHAAIYWWNPLVVKEFVNSAHMDSVALPFVLCALLFVMANKPVRSGLFLALAVGAKIWPLMLIPPLLRAVKAPPRRVALALGAGTAVLALLCVPVAGAFSVGGDSGFLAYGERWEMNDALFMVFKKGTQAASSLLGFGGKGPHVKLIARGAALLALLAWVAWVSRKPMSGPGDLCNRMVLIVAAVFMLSPTQFPWYYLWMVPLLALSPRPSLLLLTPMLSLYYLKFYFSVHDNVDFFHNGVVWIEYAPVWLLMLWEWRASRRPSRRPSRRGRGVTEAG